MATRDFTRYPVTDKVRAARAELLEDGPRAFVEKREAKFNPACMFGTSTEIQGRCPFCMIRLDENGLCCCLTVG